MDDRVRGSTSTLDVFVREHGQSLVGFAFVLTGDADASQDAVQAVLARLADRGIDDLEDPKVYARRAVLNECRSRGRRVTKLLAVLPRLVRSESHDPSVIVDDRDAIVRAMSRLSERERIAITLRYLEDLPDSDSALVMGCRPATVRSLIHRALPKMRQHLEPTAVDESLEGPPS